MITMQRICAQIICTPEKCTRKNVDVHAEYNCMQYYYVEKRGKVKCKEERIFLEGVNQGLKA